MLFAQFNICTFQLAVGSNFKHMHLFFVFSSVFSCFMQKYYTLLYRYLIVYISIISRCPGWHKMGSQGACCSPGISYLTKTYKCDKESNRQPISPFYCIAGSQVLRRILYKLIILFLSGCSRLEDRHPMFWRMGFFR